nr:hypothetical protein [Tanacetum cinerariifolium]
MIRRGFVFEESPNEAINVPIADKKSPSSEPRGSPHDAYDGLLPVLIRRDINSLFGRIASLSRRLCGRETAHALVEKKGKAKDKYYGKLILDLGNEVHSSIEQGTAAMERMVEKLGNVKDKTKVQAYEFYQEMIRRGFVFEESPNEAINVPIADKKRPSSEP